MEEIERYNKRTIGSDKEHKAADYLKEKGYEILQFNFFSRCGEIDIIARDRGVLVFVEVKYRKNLAYGLPQEAVTYYKQKALIKTARYYLLTHGYGEYVKCRFDVVAMMPDSMELIKNAFMLE